MTHPEVLGNISGVEELPSAEPDQSRPPEPRPAQGLPEGLLLSMLAHELRTPLQSIALSAELGLLRLRSSQDGVPIKWMTERLEQVQRASRSLRGIVETVLGAAQIEAGRLTPHLEDLDLREVVREVLSRAREDLAWAGCEATLEAPGPVPGRADRMLVELIANNLIGNAMKYGAGRPVHVVVARGQQRARLEVQDQGPGIPPAEHARIFERFVRLPSASVVPGAGLGLWIVRHAVQALGGEVRVQSAPGRGATFLVELPMGEKNETP